MTTLHTTLLPRLHAIRRSARRRLIVYGLFAVPAGGVVALFTIIAIDWLLLLPALLRIVVTAFFFAGFVAASYRWIIQPARTNLNIQRIAARLERYFPQLGERLSSTVNFLDRDDAGSPAIIRRAVTDTERVVGELPLESIFSVRPLAARGVLLAIAVLALAATGWAAPSWLTTGFQRYLAPFGPAEWPKRVSIVSMTGDVTVAVGDAVTLRMRIVHGWTEDLRGLVRLQEPGGAVMSRTLRRETGDTFSATIDSVTASLDYWFEAGDDSTQRTPGRIHVVQRPEVVRTTASVKPPPYSAVQSVRTFDPAEGPIRAPLGGTMTLTVQASKPIPTESGGAGLALDPEGWIPLTPRPDDPRELSAEWNVTEDRNFRIELQDEFGFSNRGALRHSVLAVADAAPDITVLEPAADVEVTAGGFFDVAARVEDDFGLTDLRLVTTRQSDGKSDTLSLSEGPAGIPEEDRVVALVRRRWSVEALSPSPGDVLVQVVEASDNRPEESGGKQWGRSPPVRIRIISDVEFETRLRDDLAMLEERIRRAALDEAEVLDQTVRLAPTDQDDRSLDAAEREAASTLVTRQARLIRRVEEVARRLTDLADQGRRNRARDEALYDQVAALGMVLKNISGGPMSSAATALNRSIQTVPPSMTEGEPASPPAPESAPRASLREAAREEEVAVNRLRALIEIMSQWGTFQGLTTKTRDLLDRQNAVLNQTVLMGRSTLGKPVESLTPEETAELKRTQRQQEQLSNDVEQHLARMSQLAASSSSGDATDKEAIESALRAARAQELTKKLNNAADAIEGNRTSAAALEQKAAMEALRAMADALGRRDRRELENLRKDLARWSELVERLILEQESLRTLTEEAGRGTAAADIGPLLDEQRRIRNNTRLLSDEWAEQPRMASSVGPIRDAFGSMNKAEAELKGRRFPPATDHQAEAVRLLREALVRLSEMDAMTAAEEFLRSLTEIREELDSMLAAQRLVNEGIARLSEGITTGARLTRGQARESSKLAGQQQEIRTRIDALRPDVSKVVVYSFALDRIGGWMDLIRTRLDERRMDAELGITGRRITRELEQLIAALTETQKFPRDEEFAEAERGGEGSGGASLAGKSVPPIAELLVLKAMQQEINERTRLLSASIDREQAAEGQLRELSILAEDQSEVRRLTERVTRGSSPDEDDSND